MSVKPQHVLFIRRIFQPKRHLPDPKAYWPMIISGGSVLLDNELSMRPEKKFLFAELTTRKVTSVVRG
jgi:hypothetical protein